MKQRLIQIRPDEQRVVAVLVKLTPKVMPKMLGCKVMNLRDLCELSLGRKLKVARARRSVEEKKVEPRWKLGSAEPVEGYGILYGDGIAGPGACPVDAEFVRRNIVWLPAENPFAGLSAEEQRTHSEHSAIND